MTNSDAVPPASAPAATAGEPLRISDDERARLPKLGVPDDTVVEGISDPPLRPEVQEELDAFREHLTWHREDSAPDCRFCTERDAKKRPAATAGTDPSLVHGFWRKMDTLTRPAAPTGEEAETPNVEAQSDLWTDARLRAAYLRGRAVSRCEIDMLERRLAAAETVRDGYRQILAVKLGYHLIPENTTVRQDAASYVKPSEFDDLFANNTEAAMGDEATELAALRARVSLLPYERERIAEIRDHYPEPPEWGDLTANAPAVAIRYLLEVIGRLTGATDVAALAPRQTTEPPHA
jgi:hypothetical protein